MNAPKDRDYYLARAVTSRDLALRAKDPSTAAIHAEFATRYDLLAAQPDVEATNKLTAAQAT